MFLLIVDENPDVVSAILTALSKTGGRHQAHTAASFETARAAAAKMHQLDVLIASAQTSNGDSGFALRDELAARFTGLRSAFLSDHDIADWSAQVGASRVFGRPPDEGELLAWAAEVGIAEPEAAAPQAAAPPGAGNAAPVPAATRSGIPVPLEDDDDDDDELPVADTLSAPGKRLGDYELVRLIGGDGQTETHQATQLSIDRQVALVLLKPKYAADDDAVREFRGIVRSRARVSHPHIAPVYEGYEEAGALFYTRELIEGKHLPELFEAGQKIDDPTLVEMVRAIAESLAYLDAQVIAHDPLRTRHIYLGADGQTRIANIATFAPEETMTATEQIRYLGAKLQPFLQPGGSGVGDHLLKSMRDPAGPADWDALLEAVTAAKKDIAERTTYRVKTTLLESKPRTRWWIGGAVAALVVLAVVYITTAPKVAPPKPRALDEMLRIPGGEFVYGDGGTATLPTFWIDRSEVTISEYAQFLEALGLPHTTEFDHPDQPGEKVGHQPEDWDNYYSAAVRGARYGDKLIDLNCPITFVDWWDAYAYSRWLGRRLPTEQEWEKAGGKAGQLYPWGDDPDPERLVCEIPGYVGWRPVDSVPGDTSPDGVFGMAGNVSEWTATWAPHPDIFGLEVPVMRGGSFNDDPKTLPNLTVRKTVRDADTSANPSLFHTEDVGFRTVSDTDPTLGS